MHRMDMNRKGQRRSFLQCFHFHTRVPTLWMCLGMCLHQSAGFNFEESKRGKLKQETADFTFGVVVLPACHSMFRIVQRCPAYCCLLLLYSIYFIDITHLGKRFQGFRNLRTPCRTCHTFLICRAFCGAFAHQAASIFCSS